MTKEQKDLLLKELCARMPYDVKVNAPFTSNKNENAKGYKINGINFRVIEWTPTLFGEKKRRNSIIIEAFSEKYNQYCSIDLELNNYIEEVKLYLFPISSMTKEQCIKLFEILGMGLNSNYGGDYVKINDATGITFFFESGRDIEAVMKAIDYLNSINVDYRGLIPKGLAIDATNLNIY